jgi:serine/threonine-protein kinase
MPSRSAPDSSITPVHLACPTCGKVLEAEPNFCPACGADLRGLSGSADTLDGGARQTIDGRYRILEKLGEGGMGTVYKVEHVRMGKIAALKLLRPDHAVDKGLKGRFLQEARVVARLSHPNTVQVFDSGELDDGSLFIAMEYVPGKDLAWHLKAHGPLKQDAAIAIGIQLLSSLQEAHEAGIVHRDIKPANVMLARRRKSTVEQVKLLDFGIAKLQEAEGRKSTTGEFVGTPAYMSPEQIRGEAVDGRSDLYSLGALLFELVSGRQLFVGPTPISVLTQHTQTPPPRLTEVTTSSAVSPAFEAVLLRALEKRAADRHPDAEAMRTALEALLDRRALPAPQLTPAPTDASERMLSREDYEGFERRLRLRRALAPLVALAVLLGGAAVGWRALTVMGTATTSDHELEPDETPATATRIVLGQDVSGAIGAGPSAEAGDRDLFRVEVPGGPVRITLSGVPDLNLTLELLQLEQTGRLRRLVFLDEVGPGGGERLDALGTRPGTLWVRVEERAFHTEPRRSPRERANMPYLLRVEAMEGGDGLELEPNDTPGTAQALTTARAVTGFLGERLEDVERATASRPEAPFSSPDYFRVEAPEGRLLWAVVVPPERGAVQVAVLDEGDARRPRSLEARAAPLFLELRGTLKSRRLRLVAGRDTQPGDRYLVALADLGPHGLDAVLEVADQLKAQGRDGTRRLLLEGAAQRLASAPEASRLAP